MGVSVIDLKGQGPVGFVLVVAAPMVVVLFSWRLGVPTSMTLALVGAMIGWALTAAQHGAIHWAGVTRVLVGIPASVVGGGLLAMLTYRVVRAVLGTRSHASVISLARWQFVTAAAQALAYGANDMEKTVGLFAVSVSIPAAAAPASFSGAGPLFASFAMFYAGALLGGWRVARRIGFGVLKVRPMQALSQQLASGATVSALAFAGAPVSMTQTIDGGLVGVGAALRVSAIRWGIVRQMVGSWLLTLPVAVLSAAILHLVVRLSGVAP